MIGWVRAIQSEKKNPKFMFSRTRKAWNRRNARHMGMLAEGFGKLSPNKIAGGEFTNRDFTRGFRKAQKRYSQKLKRLGG